MTVVAVERALILLRQLAEAPNGLSVREAARALGYGPSVVQKTMQSLVSQGFAKQDDETQVYFLGPAAMQVGLAGLAKLEIRQVARPFLRTLASATGETALIAVRQGDHAIYVDKVLSANEIRMDAPIGITRPYNATGVGKVLLAHMPEAEIDRLARDGKFLQSTIHSLTDLTRLRQELAEIREHDVAFDREEFVVGGMCVAAPIRDHDGHVGAAVAISGPTERFRPKQAELVRLVNDCAHAISAALGYHT